MSKAAIVVIHGMGSQYPMDTISKFTDNFFRNKKVYSSPERITDDYELRKLIGYDNAQNRYDCFEFYWAHMVDEPTMTDTVLWMLHILYCKKSSERFKVYKIVLQIVMPIFFVLGVWLIFWYYKEYLIKIISVMPASQILIVGIPILVISGIKFVLRKLMSSFGDVIRYTVPAPGNLATKKRISSAAVEFLVNLHANEHKYDRIVIVGHSLGSVIAYDMLVNTFGQLNKEFGGKNGIDESDKNIINELDKPELRLKALGPEFKWKVTDFITCGSPLSHAHMLLVKNEEMFIKKVQKGEYPVCPSHREDLFYGKVDEKGNKYYIPCHDSVFSFVKWTNIYFSNDSIGGDLKNVFGGDITDYKVKPQKYRGLWKSHSHYWDRKREPDSFNIIKDVLGIGVNVGDNRKGNDQNNKI